jgi:hypothetical protein
MSLRVVHARFLAPLVKARGFGMTPSRDRTVSYAGSVSDPEEILDQFFPRIGKHALWMELHALDRVLSVA